MKKLFIAFCIGCATYWPSDILANDNVNVKLGAESTYNHSTGDMNIVPKLTTTIGNLQLRTYVDFVNDNVELRVGHTLLNTKSLNVSGYYYVDGKTILIDAEVSLD